MFSERPGVVECDDCGRGWVRKRPKQSALDAYRRSKHPRHVEARADAARNAKVAAAKEKHAALVAPCLTTLPHGMEKCPVFRDFPALGSQGSLEECEFVEDAASHCHPEAFEPGEDVW